MKKHCLIPSCFTSSLLIISQITGAFNLSSLTVGKLLDKLMLLFFNLFVSKMRILYKSVIFMFCLPQSVALVLLEEVAISPTIEPLSRRPTNRRTIIPKEFLHFCKSSRAHNRFPKLEIWQRDSQSPGNMTLKASGI